MVLVISNLMGGFLSLSLTGPFTLCIVSELYNNIWFVYGLTTHFTSIINIFLSLPIKKKKKKPHLFAFPPNQVMKQEEIYQQ